MDSSKSDRERFVCCFCEERLTTYQNLLEHVRSHDTGLVCSICNKTFPSKDHVAKHAALTHSNGSPYTCDVCNKRLNSENKLTVHLTNNCGRNLNNCDMCGKLFSSKVALKSHGFIHSEGKPHVCDVCGKHFSQRGNLKRHHFIHTGEKRHVCHVCGKKFTRKDQLNRHNLIHDGEKPHECDVCGKRFTHKSNLGRHHFIHAGLKPHVCDICGKQFNQKVNLITHYLIHAGEKSNAYDIWGKRFTRKSLLGKPHVCDVCGKRFTRKDHLNTHHLIHAAEKLHACDVCGKRFTRKSVLNKHQLIHSADNPHACDICGKGFSLKRDLNRHFQSCNGTNDTFNIPRENVERDGSTDCHAGHRTIKHAGSDFSECVSSKFPKVNCESNDYLEGYHTSKGETLFHGDNNTEAAYYPAPYTVGQNRESQLCSFPEPNCVTERLQKPSDSITERSHPAPHEDKVVERGTASLPESTVCTLPQALDLRTYTNNRFRATASASQVHSVVPDSMLVDNFPQLSGGDNVQGSSSLFKIGGALYHCEKCDALFSQKVAYEFHCLLH